MDYEGTQHPAGPYEGQVPRKPAGAPVPRPAAPPPMPAQAPPASALEIWLRTPRETDAPGIYGFGHTPRSAPDPERAGTRRLLGGAALAVAGGLLVWSLCWNGYLPFWIWPLIWLTPDSWRSGTGDAHAFAVASNIYYVLFALLLALIFGRLGNFAEVWRRCVRPLLSALWDKPAPGAAPEDGRVDPVEWPELREAGQYALADRLAAEVRSGRMNDVDYTRIRRAWTGVRADPARLGPFTDAVLRQGAAACGHPSGGRDVPYRAAPHDVLVGQVRIGRGADDARNPYQHRGSGIALDPALLGTGLLAVGPPGSGKTRSVVRPVVESLCLQALAGRAAVVAVGPAGADLGPAGAFDVVISLADPASRYDLDLYGGGTDPDAAAGTLAEALLDARATEEGELRGATTALAQILGPYATAHGRFPSVAELRELLDGTAHAYAALRDALGAAGAPGMLRELDARERQVGRPGDIGPRLADRVALLERPAFAGFFDVTGRSRPFSMYALEHPLRVRIDLPERGHAEASRILARLVLAQFTAAVTARRDRSLFACLVLDDAAHTVTADAVRGMARLRSANAGILLTLRTLDDVPESLRTSLLGSVGCRMVLSGVTTWDGKRFAEAWGTTWVETEDVTRTPDQSGGMLRRGLRGVRRLFTGVAVTTESVTVRKVERERWSASDLAHGVPAGHAVLSLTTTAGEHAPPVLLDLRA
ncbi:MULTISPECIES: ATP-binding protein [unclassified Streptomyces]|uniref:ATP-binding protein n=1 Tax=unclassified Streptomyces TaxID=2593676 RepID=UPI000B81CF5A|nr:MULTISPECIES: ATP-binding protein [unclassified Streptomyces]MYS20021.1 ATP-binding protein [Streptomyces sp. SID4948]